MWGDLSIVHCFGFVLVIYYVWVMVDGEGMLRLSMPVLLLRWPVKMAHILRPVCHFQMFSAPICVNDMFLVQ